MSGAISMLLAMPGGAQTHPAFQSETRLDLYFANANTVQVGGGGAWIVDRNVRLVLLGGLGSTIGDGRGAFSARADLLGRFVLDPDGVNRWALYGAGGLGLRYEAAPRWRAVLVGLIGLEGPRSDAGTPFIELGYGGGLQVGFGMRLLRSRGR